MRCVCSSPHRRAADGQRPTARVLSRTPSSDPAAVEATGFMRQPQFHRIRRLPPYVFGEVNAMKAAARAAGQDIIDLGMDNPDSPTPAAIVDKLVEAVRNPRTHRY